MKKKKKGRANRVKLLYMQNSELCLTFINEVPTSESYSFAFSSMKARWKNRKRLFLKINATV